VTQFKFLVPTLLKSKLGCSFGCARGLLVWNLISNHGEKFFMLELYFNSNCNDNDGRPLKLHICLRPLAIKTSSFEASSFDTINEVIFMFQCSNPTMVFICLNGLPTYVPLVTKEYLSHCGGAWQNISKEKKRKLGLWTQLEVSR
jgi:hypothetical protein